MLSPFVLRTCVPLLLMVIASGSAAPLPNDVTKEGLEVLCPDDRTNFTVPCSCALQSQCGPFEDLLMMCRERDQLVAVRSLNCGRRKRDTNREEEQEGSGAEEEEEVETVHKLDEFNSENLIPTAGEEETAAGLRLANDDNGSGTEEEEEEEEEEEGSGDQIEVSTTEETKLSACNFDCSVPILIEESNSTEKDPNLLDEFHNVFQDIFADSKEKEEEHEELESKVTAVPKSDAGRNAVVPIQVTNEKEKIQDAEGVSQVDPTETGQFPLGRNTLIVIALLVFMICIVAYSVIARRRRKRPRPGHAGEEMKTMAHTATNAAAPPEKLPLINGQNGQNGNMNGKPVEEPVARKRHDAAEEEQEEAAMPLMRTKRGDETLLPETHRVTVLAKELNAPKTPMLVTRMRGQDGEIITTPDVQPQSH